MLSTWTGVGIPLLRELQLTRWVGRLSEDIPPRGLTPWILPLGIYHRVRRRPGLMYCPQCLRESVVDARWMWRMGWTVCCRQHRKQVHDCCAKCGLPYMPHRSAPSLLGRMTCPQCGDDLSRSEQSDAPVWARQFQQRLETALLEGRCQIAGRQYLGLPLFSGLRSLAALLLTRCGRELSTALVGRAPIGHQLGSAIELQPLAIRMWVMEAIWIVLQDWPDAFLYAAHRAGFRQHMTTNLGREWAFWLQRGIDQLEGRRQRVVSPEEATSILAWLKQQGVRPSLIEVLKAADVPVPCQAPQPGISEVLLQSHPL